MCCDKQKNLDTLQALGITKTRVTSIPVTSSNVYGIPIGQGKCKAVVLKANHFIPNTTTPQISNVQGYFYYGDSQQQSYEYIVNVGAANVPNVRSSELIICNDLQDVWVRFPDIFAEDVIWIDIIVYE